jgi:hypothetical protein
MDKLMLAALLAVATLAAIACIFQLPKLWAWVKSLTGLSGKWVKWIEDGVFWGFLFVVSTLVLRALLKMTQ